MTKLVPLIFLCMFFICTIAHSQSSPAGSFFISSGVGIIPSYTGKTTQTDFPAVNLEIGYRISKGFSLNTYFGYTAVSSTPKVHSDGIESEVQNKTKMIGLKGQFHRNFTDKIEMYGGALVGISSFKRSETDMRTGEKVLRTIEEPSPYNPNAPTAQFLYSGVIGCKYWLNPKVGAYTELGFGISLLNLGVSVKL